MFTGDQLPQVYNEIIEQETLDPETSSGKQHQIY